MDKNKLNWLGLIATVVGFAATLLARAVEKEEMTELVKEEVRLALRASGKK